MKKSSEYQTLQLSPASFPPACCPGLPQQEALEVRAEPEPSAAGSYHLLARPTIPFLILFIWEDCGFVWSCQQSLLNLPFMLQLLSQIHLGSSTVWATRGQESPCTAEPWFCVRSSGLPLLCRYLLWTSSSRSQLGKGWPIL